MCFPVIAAMAVAAVTSILSTTLAKNSANKQAAAAYNQQSRQAEAVNKAALTQQAETDSRNRVERLRQSETAADRARSAIRDNQRAQAAARASAGSSGLMGLPFNMLDQTYQSMIGGINTNLTSQQQQLDENYFFSSMNSMMQANNVTNQAVPLKPQLQSVGVMDFVTAGLDGLSAGMSGGGFKKGPAQTSTPLPTSVNFPGNF